MNNGVKIPVGLVKHVETLTFNSNGKYIFSGNVPVVHARALSGNLAVIIGSNGDNTVLTLYNIEGTGWTRITSSDSYSIEYWTS